MVGPPPGTGASGLASLVNQVSFTIRSSLATSTANSYRKNLDHFSTFIKSITDSKPIPLNPGILLLYLASLQQLGFSSSTIISKLSSLNYYHKLAGFTDITSHFLVSKFVTGLKKINSSSDTRLPVTPLVLNLMHLAIPKVSASSYYTLLYQSMFSLAFFAFLRPGEFTHSPNNLMFHQVAITQAQLSVTFIKYKHHNGPPVTVLVQAQSSSPCPVGTLHKYLGVRGQIPGPLYINPDGSPISYHQFSKVLALVQSFTSFTSRFHPHSFRIGAATHAALKGVPEEDIKRMGRWASFAFRKYIRIRSFYV